MENENQTGTVLQEETAAVPAAAEQSVSVDALPGEEAQAACNEEGSREDSASEKQTKETNAIPVTPEMVDKCKIVLGTMLDYLGLPGTVKAEGKANKINLLIASEDPGRIIGRKGQSLASLQTLLNRMMQKGEEQLFPKIYIDIDGYSSNSKRGEKNSDNERRSGKGRFKDEDRSARGEKRERSFSEKDAQLQQQALDAAKEVRRWGEPVTLPKMNAHDRRIIHITLEKEADLATESIGEGNFKSVVITLKKVEEA